MSGRIIQVLSAIIVTGIIMYAIYDVLFNDGQFAMYCWQGFLNAVYIVKGWLEILGGKLSAFQYVFQ